MKILVYGAGVIGSIYAAKLYQSGMDITLLARGNRYETLQQNGVIINDIVSKKQITSKLPLNKDLRSSDIYDLVIVAVRLDQLESVKKNLNENTFCKAIMFMLNNPGNSQQLLKEFPGKKIILGFPGVGGVYNNGQINYIQIKEQKTTIGDIDGNISDLTIEIKNILERAGFKVAVSTNMQAWLKIHAVFITCVSASIIMENGDSIRLGKNKRSVQMMVKGISEGFKACKKMGMAIVPKNLETIFLTMPQWFSVWYWQKAMRGKTGTLAIAPHANAAKEEMQLMAEKVLDLVHSSPLPTPNLDKLLSSFIQCD